MTESRILPALLAAALALASNLASADDARTVVWLTHERAPSDAVRLEAEAAGFTLVVADGPTGADGGARLANARAMGRVLGGAFTVYVEQQGTPTVFVIAADGTIAHAPLSDSRFSQRALALVAMSLVEDLGERAVPVTAPAPAEPAPEETPTVLEAPAPGADADANATAQPEPATSAAPAQAEAVIAAPTEQVPDPSTGEMVTPPTVLIVDAPPGSEVRVDVHPAEPPRRVLIFGGDVVPFVGTSSFTRGQAVRHLSLNLFVGFDAGLEGFEVGGLANLHRGDVQGAQVAGLLNGNGGNLEGAQIAGIGNYAGGNVEGAQLSGIGNYAGGNVEGIQASSIGNIARGNVHGFQISGGFNWTGGELRGLQAGNVNFARGFRGAQLGQLNISAAHATGAQVGQLNITRGDHSGAQVGLVNVTRGQVHGLQVGLVNVSDDADFALGLVNIVRNGRTHIEMLGNDSGFLFAAVKHGGRHFHSVYSLGVNPFEDAPMLAAGLGFGGRITPGDRVFIDLDVVGHVLVDRDTADGNGQVESLSSGRALLGIRLVDRLSLMVGASYDVLVSPRDRTEGFGLFQAERLNSEPSDVDVLGWPSLMVGLQVL